MASIDSKKYDLPFETGHFCRNFWKTFDPIAAAELLVDHRKSYFGHREITTAGYMSWAFDPFEVELRREIMRAAVLFQVEKAEEKALRSQHPKVNVDFTARHILLGPEFLAELYYPLGGIAQARQTRSVAELSHVLTGSEQHIQHVLEIMRIHHWAIHHSSLPKRRYPSLKGSVQVMTDMKRLANDRSRKFDFQSSRTRQKAWGARKETVALIYAALDVHLESGTILESYTSGKLLTCIPAGKMQEWMSKARYVAHHVLLNSAEPGIAHENIKYLPHGDMLPIPLPEFSAAEQQLITSRFREKAPRQRRIF